AISYDAPPVDMVMRRVQVLAKAYLEAGGKAPRLQVHDENGAEMIRLAARHGRGLPVDVVPLELPKVGAFGHAERVAALAAGFASVRLLVGQGADMDAIGAQVELARAIGGEAVAVIDTPDPDVMADALYAEETPGTVATPVRPMGTRRQITRQAAKALHPETEVLSLPEGAPYGAVVVDDDSCTLCLSCVSLCPSGALGDNPDRPELRFQEDACLQCGLCANVCPEDAISYEPRLDLTDAALGQRVLKEEEPFACIECGALFGVKSTVERITAKLEGHSMFGGDKLRMIQMCDDCRVNAQFHSEDNPFAAGERPKVRTTEDYLSKRRDH
ncbi:MAG: 4Fe-4S binding protein, partial [Roseovarius indicus]